MNFISATKKYDTFKDKTVFFLLAFAFVFKIKWATPIILFLLVISFFDKPKITDSDTIKKLCIVFGSMFFLYILSYIFKFDSSPRLIIRSLGFVFIPLLFLLKKFSLCQTKNFAYSFLVLQLIHILYIDFIVIQYYLFSTVRSFEFFNSLVENRFILERPYFALNCLLSIVCIKFVMENSIIKKGFLFCFLAIIVITLFIIAARLAMGISVLLSFLFFLKEKKIVYFIILSSILAITIISNRYIIQRIAIEKGEPRIAIWQCAKSIVDEKGFNYFTGTFSSEVVDNKLISCYNSKEVSNGPYWWIGKNNYKYNTHNQFLWFFTSYGLIGIILFLFVFVIHICNFYKFKNEYSLFFVLIFLFQCLFENVLSRQLGIYVFLWFCFIFINSSKNILKSEG
jgi:O-antigen ligase